jgi:hypothetical protein
VQWEQQTTLSAELMQAVDLVTRLMATSSSSNNNSNSTPSSALSTDALVDVSAIHTLEQFHEWFTALEASEACDDEEQHALLLRLQRHERLCGELCATISAALGDLEALDEHYGQVTSKTGALQRECESLLDDQRRLSRYADGLGEKLDFFNELERVSRTLATPGLSAADASYRSTLERVDECVAFIQRHMNYHDAQIYLTKFRMQQVRALTAIKEHVVALIRTAAQEIRARDARRAPGAAAAPDGDAAAASAADASVSESLDDAAAVVNENDADASLFYAKFRAIAPRIRPLTTELERRSARRECAALLNDCYAAYFGERAALLSGVVSRQLAELAQVSDVRALARSGCAYLLRVSDLEWQLFRHLFGRATPALAELIDELAAPFCDALRMRAIASRNLDELCALAHILAKEVLEEQVAPRGTAAAAFQPVAERALRDVQERLAFVAQRHIRDHVSDFRPSDADIDYPARLALTSSAFASWYAPLHSTLMLLSKLYLAVDLKVFEGVAHEAVSACTAALVDASKLISARRKGEPTGGVDGLLFLVRHLLILREQIQPFEVNFSIREQTLDVAHLIGAVGELLAGKRSILATAPRLLDTHLDSKADLEKVLRQSIEAFVALVTTLIAQPLLHVETLAAAYVHLHASNASALSSMPFVKPDKLAAAARDVLERVDTTLPAIVSSTVAYLTNHKTQQILFKPIRVNIAQCFEELYLLLDKHYNADERAQVNPIDGASLAALLDQKLSPAAILAAQQQRELASKAKHAAASALAAAASAATGVAQTEALNDRQDVSGTDTDAETSQAR